MTAGGPDRGRMRLVGFKPLTKGALRGFATVQLSIGLTIEDCPVLTTGGRVWAALPGKPVLDREGRQAKPDGKPQYAAILKWRDRELADRWSAAVVELVRERHPELFDERAA